jgi:hypothetical protein
VAPPNTARFSIVGWYIARTASERFFDRATSSPVVNTVATSTSSRAICNASSAACNGA